MSAVTRTCKGRHEWMIPRAGDHGLRCAFCPRVMPWGDFHGFKRRAVEASIDKHHADPRAWFRGLHEAMGNARRETRTAEEIIAAMEAMKGKDPFAGLSGW